MQDNNRKKQSIYNVAKNVKIPPPPNFWSLAGKTVFDWSGKMQRSLQISFCLTNFFPAVYTFTRNVSPLCIVWNVPFWVSISFSKIQCVHDQTSISSKIYSFQVRLLTHECILMTYINTCWKESEWTHQFIVLRICEY
jgi:hypothetical protein